MSTACPENWYYGSQHPHNLDLAKAVAAARTRLAKKYLKVLASAGELYQQGNDAILRGLVAFDRDADLIQAGWAWAAERRQHDPWAAKACRDYAGVGIHIMQLRLSYRDQIAWLEAAIAACTQLADRPGEAAALCNLGAMYCSFGDARKAIGYHRQSLAITKDTGDRRGERRTLGNLGIAYYFLGEVRKAITSYTRSLAICRELGDRRDEEAALNNLGLAHYSLGQASKAIEFHQQSLALAQEIVSARRTTYRVLAYPARAALRGEQ